MISYLVSKLHTTLVEGKVTRVVKKYICSDVNLCAASRSVESDSKTATSLDTVVSGWEWTRSVTLLEDSLSLLHHSLVPLLSPPCLFKSTLSTKLKSETENWKVQTEAVGTITQSSVGPTPCALLKKTSLPPRWPSNVVFLFSLMLHA